VEDLIDGSVGIRFEEREVAGRHVDPDPVTASEEVRDRPHLDVEAVDPAVLEGRGSLVGGDVGAVERAGVEESRSSVLVDVAQAYAPIEKGRWSVTSGGVRFGASGSWTMTSGASSAGAGARAPSFRDATVPVGPACRKKSVSMAGTGQAGSSMESSFPIR